MTAKSTHDIQDLSPGDIKLLGRLFCLPSGEKPNPSWLETQAHHLSSIPSSFTKPFSLLPRLVAMALPSTQPRAVIYETHKMLNRQLIHQIFLELSAESTTRLTTLNENPFPPPAVSNFLLRIHKINSLWMAPEVNCQTFNPKVSDTRCKHIASGCETCMIASISGNHSILSDLRASIIGRKKKGHPIAKVLPLIEAWIDQTGKGDVIRRESDVLVREIRHCRRQMQKARRQEIIHNIAKGVLDVGSQSMTLVDGKSDVPEVDESGQDEHDFEGSIINCYANRMSAFIGDPDTQDHRHPKFRHSIFVSTAVKKRQQMTQEQLDPRRHSLVYTESDDDNLTSVASSLCKKQHMARQMSWSDHAQSYMHLIDSGERENAGEEAMNEEQVLEAQGT